MVSITPNARDVLCRTDFAKAFWGAEESGLVGSLYYTSQLSEAEVDKIKYYFNYDMIGSPNPIFAIARDENSGIGPQLLEAYLASQGKNVSFGSVEALHSHSR